ncbi:MarR family winged helix-turn-helix transcriptional regulator [Cellvibrio polysaccharolyticus]|uniref:MarR family transcriptional regulator n=1 Tax=Cellvibrio polysaccharolyticus TaxID=2082724 RepID=A0A928YT08_9GAMM|nr:MarR family transcriptional regulator [Cellvibrio polysaccharolyticus]MBE8716981.1 MarR family transcriptional regulator [Cellvibrio polysaccharolyticus]
MSKTEEVLIALRRVIRATDLHSRQLIKTASVTAPQLLLMQAIHRQENAIISKLAQEVSLSQATVTTILDRLEKRELVYRQRSEQDKRKVHVHLTAAGQTLLKSAPTALQQEFVNRFNGLPDWEQSMILASLQRIAHMMNAQDIDASPFLDTGELDRQI